MKDLETWLAALTTDTQPSASEFAAAPGIEDWRWSPTDTAGMYVRGRADGRDFTTGEIVEIDKGRRWVRDKDGVPYRLGCSPDVEWHMSCGCAFCDIGLAPEWIDGRPAHRAQGDVIECRNPAVERR